MNSAFPEQPAFYTPLGLCLGAATAAAAALLAESMGAAVQVESFVAGLRLAESVTATACTGFSIKNNAAQMPVSDNTLD